jgi:hypothetical protein
MKQPGREAYHLTPYGVEVKNKWSCTFVPSVPLHAASWRARERLHFYNNINNHHNSWTKIIITTTFITIMTTAATTLMVVGLW